MPNRAIVCIAETHLAKDRAISTENYIWFGYNQDLKHVKSSVTHGGVGILVKNNIFTAFNVCVVDKEVDGILVVEFKSKINDTKFVLFCCLEKIKNLGPRKVKIPSSVYDDKKCVMF